MCTYSKGLLLKGFEYGFREGFERKYREGVLFAAPKFVRRDSLRRRFRRW